MSTKNQMKRRSTTLFVEPFILIGVALVIAALFILRDSTPSNLVVLLEDPKGNTGSVVVSSGAGEQILDKSGVATGVSSANEAPRKPFQLKKSEIDDLFGRTIKSRPLLPASFTLYFEPNSSRLTADAVTNIENIVGEVRRRSISEIFVIGHADRTGRPEVNVRISLRRAEVVRDALVAKGVKRADLKVDSFGDRDPVVPTGPGVAEPRNRRVEVIVR